MSAETPAYFSANPVARRLMNVSLLPFVLGAALVWFVRPELVPFVAGALSAYAAVLLGGLGGIHWGLAFRQRVPSPSLFVSGALLAVAAWLGALMPAHAGLVVQGVALAGSYLADRRVYAAQGVGAWLTLRFRLSVIGALCCFLAAAGHLDPML